jgi:hypothetical protein
LVRAGAALATALATQPLHAQSVTPAQVQAATALLTPVVKNGASDANLVRYLTDLHRSGGAANIVEVLYLALRQTIKEANEDKKYYLSKLQQANKAAEALADYLRYLTDASAGLAAQERGARSPLPSFATALMVLNGILARKDLSAADRVALQNLANQDRQFLATAQRLEQQTRQIALSPRLVPSPSTPQTGSRGSARIVPP